jgi:curved DNA-binding protein CbpA
MVQPQHYKILGISEDVGLDELKAAYHSAAKAAHPDLAPPSEKHGAQLRMMRINEAYMEICALNLREPNGEGGPKGDAVGPRRAEGAGTEGPKQRRRREHEARAAGAGRAPRDELASDGKALGSLRDPGYAYYKLGFTFYRRGYTELYSKDPRIIRKQLAERKTYDHYLLSLSIAALKHFEQSYRYFAAVIEYAPDSIWVADAKAKLRKLEKFNRIYQRICENLSHNLRAKREEERALRRASPNGPAAQRVETGGTG